MGKDCGRGSPASDFLMLRISSMFTLGNYTLFRVPVSCFGASGSQALVLCFGASSGLPGIFCWASLSIRGLFCQLWLMTLLLLVCLFLWEECTGLVLSLAWASFSGQWCTWPLVYHFLGRLLLVPVSSARGFISVYSSMCSSNIHWESSLSLSQLLVALVASISFNLLFFFKCKLFFTSVLLNCCLI